MSVGLLKRIFGKEKIGAKIPVLNTEIDLIQLVDLDPEAAILLIREKRRENKKKFNDNYKKAEALIGRGKYQEAQDLTSQDVLSYLEVYGKAQKLEKAGKLEEAAETYWLNIYEYGTDAPANFKRLMIVLSKLGKKREELTVANIYSAFISQSEQVKIKKRISNIEKKLQKE